MRTLQSTLAIAALLLAAACAPSGAEIKESTDEGYASLNKGDAKSALDGFEGALGRIGGSTTHPDYLRAALGRCRALARLGDVRAKGEFLALAKQMPGKVQVIDYTTIAGELNHKGQTPDAVEVIEVGTLQHPTSKDKFAEVAKAIRESATAKGDSASLAKLKGLGYTE